MCELCQEEDETTSHLFFDFKIAKNYGISMIIWWV